MGERKTKYAAQLRHLRACWDRLKTGLRGADSNFLSTNALVTSRWHINNVEDALTKLEDEGDG